MNQRLRLNPIACEAHGMCAELLPERIALDEWGYPVIDGEPLPRELVDHARRAVQACPTFALLLERASDAQRERSATARSGETPRSDINRRRRASL
jgi:ferredoxin